MMLKRERNAEIDGGEWPIKRVYVIPASTYSGNSTLKGQWTRACFGCCDTAHKRAPRQNSHYDYPVKDVRQNEPFRRHVQRFQVHDGLQNAARGAEAEGGRGGDGRRQ